MRNRLPSGSSGAVPSASISSHARNDPRHQKPREHHREKEEGDGAAALLLRRQRNTGAARHPKKNQAGEQENARVDHDVRRVESPADDQHGDTPEKRDEGQDAGRLRSGWSEKSRRNGFKRLDDDAAFG